MISAEQDFVANAHGPRCGDDRVNSGTRKCPHIAKLKSIVPNEALQDFGILGQFILGKRDHHASRIGQRDVESRRLANRKCPADPVVLDEPDRLGVEDHIHTKSAPIHAALRL